jgi:hypothetical protein
MLVTMIWGVLSRLLGIPFVITSGVWAGAYLIIVVLLYFAKIPKEFAVGNEIQLFLQYYCAFIVLYVFVDNGIALFK